MANERLRAAIRAAGLTVEDVSTRVQVDLKTVERWVSNGRVPHRRTRMKVARLLAADEVFLWPSLINDARTPPASESELMHVYANRSAITWEVWSELIKGVARCMDVLVFSGQFLVEQHDLLPVVRSKSLDGVTFRFAVGDHTSPAVIQRAEEEGTSGGLEGRVQMMRRYLQDVAQLDGVEVRTHGTILYNSIYRFDDQLLVNSHAYGALAGQNPVLRLRRTGAAPMWGHYMRSFERVWAEATPEPC